MTLPGSGTLSFTDIETEFGLISGTNTRKLGSYRVSYSNTGDNGDLTNLPLDTGVPQSGPIKFSDFYSKKLNMIVNYYSGATETRPETAWNRYTNYNSSSNSPSDDVKVIGPALNSDGTWSVTKPTNTSGKRVIIHVNKTIGSVSDSSANKCAVRTGSGWNSGTTLEINVGEEGQLLGAGGNGGEGRSPGCGTGGVGGPGTSALGIEYNGTAVTVQDEAILSAGYGGGGGGAGAESHEGSEHYGGGGGGGGGAGYPAGEGNNGGGETGGDATSTEGGEGGERVCIGNTGEACGGAGGDGGEATSAATSGGSGATRGDKSCAGGGGAAGAAGSAIRKSADGIGYTLTVEGDGAVNGSQANTSASSGGGSIGVS